MKNNININYPTNTVVKSFRSRIACDKEKYILTLLSDTSLVPALLRTDEFNITMEYCPGVLVSDIFSSYEENKICNVIKKITEWFVCFNNTVFEKTGRYIFLSDINPRNFIYNFESDTIIGIDFEAWQWGECDANIMYLPAMVKSAHFIDDTMADWVYNYALDKAAEYTEYSYQCICDRVEKTVAEISVRRQAMSLIRQCDCVIIAGGNSSRMGSPKGLLKLKDYTFTDWLIYTAQVFDNVYISANLPQYGDFNCKLIPDVYYGKGPIGAIHASLISCCKEKVFFLPCDTPFITEKTVIGFFSQLNWNADCNIICTADRIYPTIGLYSKSVLPVLEKCIEQDNLRMMNLLDSVTTDYVKSDREQEFHNINTPQDYEKYENL